MKKFSLLKLISLIFICAMLMSAVAITAFAEGEQETTPTVKIVSKNIYFGDDIQLMFAIDAPPLADVTATVDGEPIGIERFEESYTVNGVSYPTWKTKEGWAAQNIDTVVTVTVEYDGVKDVLTYSVLEYLHERIAKLNSEGNLDKEVSEGAGYTKRDQLDMYNALLDYSKAADKVVNAGHTNDLDDYFEVKVVNGTIDGYKSWGVYKLGSYPFADIETTLDYNPNTHVVVWSYTWSGGTETGLTTDEIKDIEVTGDLVITAELEEFKCDHQYTAIETVNATCTEDGYIIHECSKCYHKYEETLAATGHTHQATDRTEPTCDEDGKIVYTCACGDSYEETINATGHSYDEAITAPNCTEQGYTTFTCSVCGDEYKGNYVDATGHKYNETVTPPTCTEQGYTTYRCACGYEYKDNYVDATNHNYESERTEPTCKEDGKIVYTCTNDGCGYSYEETIKATGHNLGDDDTCDNCGMIIKWQIVTDAADLKVGDKIFIAAKDSNVAMSTTQNTSNRGTAAITKSGNTITFTSSVQIFTLQAGKKSGTFAFYTGSGYIYAASSSANNLKTQTELTDNSSWTISITSAGVATVKAQGTNSRNLLKYNSTSTLFSCYSSGQNDIVLYKLVEICAHNGLVLEQTKAPTCTETGLESGHCDICNADVTKTIEATGHNYKDGVCTGCGEKESTHKCEHVCPVAGCGKCTDAECTEDVCKEKCQGHETTKTTETISIKDRASANGWTNGTQYKTITTAGGVTITASGTTNTGKYYTSGYEWRLYQTESATITITAPKGKTIVSVKITYNTSNKGILKNSGSNVESGTTVTVNAENITFSVGNTSSETKGQVKITAIEIVYQ